MFWLVSRADPHERVSQGISSRPGSINLRLGPVLRLPENPSVPSTIMESTGAQLLASGTLGVFFSLVARQGEIEKHLVAVLALFALANVILVSWAPAYLGTTTTFQAVARVLLLDGALLTGLFGNIVLYRLFFHRLRNVPGPIGARISRFYAAYQTMKHAQMHRHVQSLHQQYGDVVRIGTA